MKKFISIDPSLRNTAIVWGKIDSENIDIDGWRLVTTHKDTKKGVRASSDSVRRAKRVVEALKYTMEEVKPDVCFGETPSGSQSSAGMLSYGVSCVYLAMLEPEVIEVTPTEIKKHVSGRKDASKEVIMDWVEERHPGILPRKKDGTILKSRAEHVADAIAAAHTGMNTKQFQLIKPFLK